ncbi:MAG: hypothetical protein JEY91_14795 [Spirochaetaceae bacterium]|nr:hypothetical protein [Spirochaetaceae bacterium]
MKTGRFFFISLSVFFLMVSCSQKNNEIREPDESSPSFHIFFNPEKPGCGNCHNSREKQEQTLAAQANKRWQDHNFDIDAKLMAINDCLLCHSVDSEGNEGVIAPKPLRTIVHQAHMCGESFQGNCFSCHIIMGDSSPDLYNYSD